MPKDSIASRSKPESQWSTVVVVVVQQTPTGPSTSTSTEAQCRTCLALQLRTATTIAPWRTTYATIAGRTCKYARSSEGIRYALAAYLTIRCATSCGNAVSIDSPKRLPIVDSDPQGWLRTRIGQRSQEYRQSHGDGWRGLGRARR